MTNDQIPMTNVKARMLVIGIWSLVILIGAAILPLAGIRSLLAAGSSPAKQKLLDRTPFDEITLTQAGGGKKLEVLPLKLPEGAQAALPKQGKLKVRLVSRPIEEFEVDWPNIAQVRVFEQILLDEARRLAAAGQFDEAYEYFARLRAEHPNFPGLDDAISDYLQQNAVALYRQKQHDRALALLLTLYQRNPLNAALPSAVQAVAGEIIQRYLREGDYAAARQVLDLWQSQFRGVAADAAADWQRRFQTAAERQVTEAQRLVNQKQFVAARKAANRALAIWPKLDSAAAVLAHVEREFPFVTVGVLESAPHKPVRRIDDWAALRASRLTEQLLAEEIDFGADGGVYRSPYGEWSQDETGRELTLKLNSPGALPTPDSISRFLLSLAVPGGVSYRPDFAGLLSSISLTPPSSLTLRFRRVHVRPESMLQFPLPAVDNPPPAAFFIADYSREQVTFTRNTTLAMATPAQAVGPQAVIERVMPTDEAAVAGLLSGDVDVLDRVPPWQLERLRASPDIRIGTYKLPTVHVLIPNLKRPLLAKREFRRALCFGIDRKWIVERVLLGGNPVQGYQAISGPFPAGVTLNDPIRYGYNNQIAVRPFEPRLAAILATVGWSSVQNPDNKKDKTPEKPLTDIPELTLALPIDPVARVACQSIEAMLVREGIRVKLIEVSADDLLAGKSDYDLRYAELTLGDPVTDARTILGPNGLAGGVESPSLISALADLDLATNWKDVRTRLAGLHEIAYHELPIIPLWQTVNYFAHRASVHGIDQSPIALYQNVGQWSLAQPSNVARSDPAQP
jgi:tetratricopeptide (TPR) repeat protein